MSTATHQKGTVAAYELARCEHLMSDPKAVFVFGSNRHGIHGAGAAATAQRDYGAKVGVSEGPMGRAYAIPTKEHWRDRRGLPLHEIREAVRRFLEYARKHPMKLFAVTRIGCGFAGYTDEQIAPLFIGAPENVELPIGWRELADFQGVWNPDVTAKDLLGEPVVERTPDPARLLRLELREIRYRLMAIGALLCEPVSDKNLREAKKLLEPVYHDAMKAFQEEKLAEPTERTRQLDADAECWRSIEPAIRDWRDAEHYPADGGSPSPAQEGALERLTAAVDGAIASLKRVAEAET